jgi:hypothetical protein
MSSAAVNQKEEPFCKSNLMGNSLRQWETLKRRTDTALLFCGKYKGQ